MPRKTRSSKVKKAQSKSTIPKRKRTKVGKAKRKMKTRGRIVSGKGSKKKLLAYGSNSTSEYASPPKYLSELSSAEERDRERKTEMEIMRAKLRNHLRKGNGGENYRYWYALRNQSI